MRERMSSLRAKAEAARAGWDVCAIVVHGGGVVRPVSEFIAAASPDVVLGLLDRIERLDAARADLAYMAGDQVMGAGVRCRLCGHWRSSRSDDAPDDHEPGCLVRREP